MVHGLDELWRRRIIREQGLGAYDFSHDKIRDVAYAEMSQARRSLCHRRAAGALEALHAADLDPVSGLIAAHYEAAGLAEQAVSYYHLAAEAAQHLYANQDALGYVAKGLALLKSLPDITRRAQQESASRSSGATSWRPSMGMLHPRWDRALAGIENRASMWGSSTGASRSR